MTSTLADLVDEQAVARIIGAPFEMSARNCQEVSLAIVRSGLLSVARVARGTCRGVDGHHSWVVVGTDCYATGVPIIDPTLWSYDPAVTGVWHGVSANNGRHVPHGGHSSIWTLGPPARATGPEVRLTPQTPLSANAQRFVDVVGPLDLRGWMLLANAPVLGWPAAEILAAMDDTSELAALVPIDRLGMLTDRNPGGSYLAGGADQ